MEKKIVSSDFCQNTSYREKTSSAFIANYISGGSVVPEIIKIEDEIAWSFYQGNEWVNAVVNRIIQDTVKHRPQIVMRDKNTKLKPKHKAQIEIVNEFLFNPNGNKESLREIRIKYLKDMLVIGRGAIEKVLNKKTGVLQEIYAIQAKNVKVKMDIHGNLLKVPYVLVDSKGKQAVEYKQEELIFSVLRPTTQNVYGEKPLDALANTVASDIIRATYNTNFFVNGAEASGILSLKDMSRGELNKFKDYWAQNHKGFGKSHRVVAVNVPIEYIKMAVNNKDMEFIEYGLELKSKIYAVYSMQPFVMGDSTGSSGTGGKTNSSEQREIYMDGAIMPLLEHECYTYTKEILHDGFGFTDLEVVFPEATRSDIKTQDEIDRNDITVGLLTINEVRASRQLPPVKWGDSPIVMPGGKLIDPNTGQLTDPKAGNEGGNSDNKKKKPVVADPAKSIHIDDFVLDYTKRLSLNEFTDSVKRKIVADNDNIRDAIAESIVSELSVVFQTSKDMTEIYDGVKEVIENNKEFLNV